MRRLATWARTAPDRAEVCAELVTRGHYERRLALVAAMVVRDPVGIAAAATSPQPLLRAGLFDRRITELSARDRRRTYRTLRRLDDPATADRLVREVREHFGDEEAAALLPACGPSVVRELLPDLEFAVNLEAVARRHPDPVAARAEQRLAAARLEDRRALWDEVGPAVLSVDPGRALDLVERFPVDGYLPGSLTAYGRLAAVDAGRVARLLRSTETYWLPSAVVRRLVTLPDGELVPLARRHLAELLAALPPSRRGDFYDRAADPDDRPSRAVMELLPAATRAREATRMLPAETGFRAYLPWAEATTALAGDLRSSDADKRLRAWRQLVLAARLSREPRAVTELVERLDRVRNEQDPVRAAALNALTGLARRLTAAAAPGLTRITTAAVGARDASPATFAALAGLAADTLRFQVDEPALREWALVTIDRVSGASAVPPLPRFDGVPPALVFDRLRGWVASAAEQGRPGPLLSLTRALGRGAYEVPELQDMLRAAIATAVGEQAITLWLADRRHRSQRVAEVLATDLTAVTVPIVWTTISSSRTDLLDRVFAGLSDDRVSAGPPHGQGVVGSPSDQVLAGPPSDLVLAGPQRGRWLETGARWIPDRPRHVERWLPRQQVAFVALLSSIVRDTALPAWTRADALRTAAIVPGAGRELVLRHRDDADVVIAEAALSALPWTDRPDEALSVLLEYAGSDRARVALHAAGRAAARALPNRLPALLGGVLSGPAKVTSRKEAARLLARCAPAEVMATLLEVFRTPDTPRDVRAAIVAGARRRLDTGAAWTILAEAHEGVLLTRPGQISGRHRPRYAELVARACRSDDRRVRLGAFAALPHWLPWVAAEDLVASRFTELGEDLTPVAATGLLRALAPIGLTRVLTSLLDRGAGSESGRGTGPELGREGVPELVRRRLDTLAAAVAAWSRSVPAAVDRSALVASARWLAAQPSGRPVAAVMLLGLGRLDNLDELADLCAGRPVLAVRVADRIRERLPFDDQVTVRRLAARGDLAGGLFAVALLSDSGSELLLTLRGHPEPEVRDEAYAIALAKRPGAA